MEGDRRKGCRESVSSYYTDTHSSTLPLKSLRIRSSTEVVTEAIVRCRLALTSAVMQYMMSDSALPSSPMVPVWFTRESQCVIIGL